MRKDMFKVIVERPRPGSRTMSKYSNAYRKARTVKLNEDLDCVDYFSGKTKVSMGDKRLNTDYKSFNENLNPLRRFIESRIGKRWDDVYSEICETLDTGSTVKQHVRQHIKDLITLKVFIDEDGEMRDQEMTYRRFSYGYNSLSPGTLYVHPVSNLICRIPDYDDKDAISEAGKKRQAENRYFKDGIRLCTKHGREPQGWVIRFNLENHTWFKYVWEIVDRAYYVFERVDGKTKQVTSYEKQRIQTKATASKKEIRDYGLNKPVL